MISDNNNSSNNRKTYHIVLTGSSGYVGQHLLHSLITTTKEKLHWFAASNNNNGDDEEKNEENPTTTRKEPPLLPSNCCYHIHALYGSMQGFPEAVAKATAADTNNNTHKNNHDADNNNSGGGIITVSTHSLDLTNERNIKEWFQGIQEKYGDKTYNNNKNNNGGSSSSSSNSSDHRVPLFDVCIHMAALSSPKICQQDSQKAYNINIPKFFFQQLQLFSPSTSIVAFSTDQVYTGSRNHSVDPYYIETNTETETKNNGPVNVYGQSKKEMEDYLLSLSSSSSSSTIMNLRSSIILGPKAPLLPEETKQTFLHFCQTRNQKNTEFYTDECRSVIYVGDVIRVLTWCMMTLCHRHNKTNENENNNTSVPSGTYNMGGPQRKSRVDMAQAVFRYFGFSFDSIVPKKKAKMMANTTAATSAVQSPLDISMDSTKLSKLIGMTAWTSLEEIVPFTFQSDHKEKQEEVEDKKEQQEERRKKQKTTL